MNIVIKWMTSNQTTPGSACEIWYGLPMSQALNDTLPCPPTLSQVIADPRFAFDTDHLTNSTHHGAACYDTLLPSFSGAGQECCYRNDEIIVGSPGSFCHESSLSEGGHLQKISSHSSFTGHIIQDILPDILCCIGNAGDAFCQLYYIRRPSDDGTQYQPWTPATGRGDPHIQTFDGLDYTFNGAGEFWMLLNTSSQPVLLQARMEKFNNASLFSAFVMKHSNSPAIQVSSERKARTHDRFKSPLCALSMFMWTGRFWI